MHELAVTESILELALRHARTVGAVRITDLYLVIGQMSTIIDDSVQFYWDFVSQGTIAQGSQLHFHRIPAEMKCLVCEKPYTTISEDLTCPVCGGTNVKLVAGAEFYLEAIDVEEKALDEIEEIGIQP